MPVVLLWFRQAGCKNMFQVNWTLAFGSTLRVYIFVQNELSPEKWCVQERELKLNNTMCIFNLQISNLQ